MWNMHYERDDMLQFLCDQTGLNPVDVDYAFDLAEFAGMDFKEVKQVYEKSEEPSLTIGLMYHCFEQAKEILNKIGLTENKIRFGEFERDHWDFEALIEFKNPAHFTEVNEAILKLSTEEFGELFNNKYALTILDELWLYPSERNDFNKKLLIGIETPDKKLNYYQYKNEIFEVEDGNFKPLIGKNVKLYIERRLLAEKRKYDSVKKFQSKFIRSYMVQIINKDIGLSTYTYHIDDAFKLIGQNHYDLLEEIADKMKFVDRKIALMLANNIYDDIFYQGYNHVDNEEDLLYNELFMKYDSENRVIDIIVQENSIPDYNGRVSIDYLPRFYQQSISEEDIYDLLSKYSKEVTLEAGEPIEKILESDLYSKCRYLHRAGVLIQRPFLSEDFYTIDDIGELL
jgi:hypothetical protein